MQIEFSVPNSLLQEVSQEFLSMAQAFLHDGTAKPEVCLEQLMAALCAVDDVGSCAILSQDHCTDPLGGRPFLRSRGFGKVPRVLVESLQTGNKQVFLPPPIEVDRGAS